MRCVFALAPSGLVVSCNVNAPGSWHDSFIAENGGSYSKLKSAYETTGGKAAVDSAFLLKQCPFHIKTGKKNVKQHWREE